MHHSVRSRLRPLRHALVITVVALAALLLGAGVALAGGTSWDGNGAEGGFCNSVSPDSSVPAGQQRWLFILTPQISNGPGTLTADFANSPDGQATGDQQGNGSVHYTVFSGVGDQLITAFTTASGGQLVVSHCEVNGTTPTTPTTPETTPTTPETTPTTPTTPGAGAPGAGAPGATSGAAAAVVVVPRLTG
jgi:hypothetical protein